MIPDFKERLLALNRRDFEYYKLHYNNGGSSEFDSTINDISREIIRLYAKHYGTVYLGKINDSDAYNNRKPIVFRVYSDPDEKIYNFEADFVIPVEDEELRKVLQERNTPGEYSGKKNADQVNKIIARIEALGGYHLSWS